MNLTFDFLVLDVKPVHLFFQLVSFIFQIVFLLLKIYIFSGYSVQSLLLNLDFILVSIRIPRIFLLFSLYFTVDLIVDSQHSLQILFNNKKMLELSFQIFLVIRIIWTDHDFLSRIITRYISKNCYKILVNLFTILHIFDSVDISTTMIVLVPIFIII